MMLISFNEGVFYMHYTRLLKRYGHPVAKKHALTDDEVNAILEYFDYLQTEYFTDIPVSKYIDTEFIYNIPKELYKYFDYSNVIDAPVTANPFIMLYGLCLNDIEQYPNFIERYLELNKEEIEDFNEFIDKRKQGTLVDPGSDE